MAEGCLTPGPGACTTLPMDDLTRELLLKTRKTATSAFGPKQWKAVLEALGFTVTVTKERTTVVGFNVATAAGEQLAVIVKEPHYRHILFYQLVEELKAKGYDLVEMTSKALGLDTPDVEKKLKDLYVRDLTNTGTCPVCGGNFKRDGTGIGHHGFKRPGDGALYGSCFAVGYLPWELSPVGAEAYVKDALIPYLEGVVAQLARLNAGEITKFFREVGYGQKRKVVEVTRESDEYQFGQMLKSAIYQAERDIKWTEATITEFKTRIANWKPDELPEVKYAGKFKVA